MSGKEILGSDENVDLQKTFDKRIAFLKAIDKGALWGETTAEAAVAYLRKEIVRYIREVTKCLYSNDFIEGLGRIR